MLRPVALEVGTVFWCPTYNVRSRGVVEAKIQLFDDRGAGPNITEDKRGICSEYEKHE